MKQSKKDAVLESFRSRATMLGEMMCLDLRAALDFVQACRENDLAITGLEGFVLEGEFIEPRLDLIAAYDRDEDYRTTWEGYVARTTEAADRLVRGIEESEVRVEFTVMDRPQWDRMMRAR